MKNIQQIKAGVLEYVNREIIAQAPTNKQFLYGIAVGVASPKIENMLIQYAEMPAVKMLGIVDDNGQVDIGALKVAAKESMRNSGKVTFAGIVFDESDIDKLAEYISRA